MSERVGVVGKREDRRLEQGNFKSILLTFLVLPIAAYLLYELLFLAIGFGFSDLDIELLVYEIGICIPLVSFVLLRRQLSIAGWAMPRGWFWLVIVGPLWLGIFTPAADAFQFYASSPHKIIQFFAVSIFVAVNEETIFRGFILGGMQKLFRPVSAAIISSVAFGVIHFLNLNSGGDIVFVSAQAMGAAAMGMVMAATVLYSKSILPAIFVHWAVDFVGLGALGGYEDAIQAAEMAPSIIVSALLFFGWGLFWVWRFQRKQMNDLK